ncbi:DJ-1/PfpI family protein [Maribacter algarum]|uniref:DJ-1/PfpI family protein n=1 Tax=Maribacter algarum (ex Zhang et al. 2020) TaxID=2578118 RepID=A0A5S3PNV3_9FLAO|nr:DJ-1/PfpI family protein [Maribacter algarum]TMM56158.1 DJ-1/PfpI family protein [Maribacter algarum]
MKSLFKIVIVLCTVLPANAQNIIPLSNTYICPPCKQSCDNFEYQEKGICTHCNMVLVRKDLAKTIAFYLQDGVEVLDFAGPMEVFVYAGYKVFIVSANQKPITSQGVLTITPDYSIENAPEADILAFFGGNSPAASQNTEVIQWVKNQKKVTHHFSVCTGAFVLAEAGILDGKTATTFHDALEDLTNNYSKIIVRKNVRFVDNGNVITTAGISAGIDGALHLVAKLQGVNAAKRTAYYMEYDNWQLGNGLVLAEDNPYKVTISSEALKEFEGRYEYKNGSQFNLVYNSKTKDLNAIINETSFPVYHENGDVFSDVRNEPVFFKRNESGQVIGYSLAQKGEVYSKLN